MRTTIPADVRWFIVSLLGLLCLAVIWGLWRGANPSWGDTVIGGSVATLFGVMVAFRLTEFIDRERLAEKHDRVLTLARQELTYNAAALAKRNTNTTGGSGVVVQHPLKDSLWSALSDSGDLAAIEDIDVLDSLATAYHAIRHVKALEGSLPVGELAAMTFKGATYPTNVQAALDLISYEAKKAEGAVGEALLKAREPSPKEVRKSSHPTPE